MDPTIVRPGSSGSCQWNEAHVDRGCRVSRSWTAGSIEIRNSRNSTARCRRCMAVITVPSAMLKAVNELGAHGRRRQDRPAPGESLHPRVSSTQHDGVSGQVAAQPRYIGDVLDERQGCRPQNQLTTLRIGQHPCSRRLAGLRHRPTLQSVQRTYNATSGAGHQQCVLGLSAIPAGEWASALH